MKLLLLILLHMAQNGKKIEQNTNPKDCPSMKILKLLLEHLWHQNHQLNNSFNLVRLVRVPGNSPMRLLALRMLQSPKGKFRPFNC